MPGGLLQLVSSGAQDLLLNGNPKASFFKKVFKTYTNFAVETMRVHCDRTSMNCNSPTHMIFKLKRHADLVTDVFLSLEIPHVRKRTEEVFEYVRNFGETMIREYYITVGGTRVDHQYGEWIHIWNELSLSADKRYGYDRMIGNLPEVFSPDAYHMKSAGEVQVARRRVFVPMLFWFNRNPGLALPLIAMQYHDVEIHVELRPIMELVRIGPSGSVAAPADASALRNYFPEETVDVDPYLEVNFVFLDDAERNFFANRPHDYLVEQVSRIISRGIRRYETIDVVVPNPIKEIAWVTSRGDADLMNSWLEYDDVLLRHQHDCESDCITCEPERGSIMSSATILFNGLERMEPKSNEYYNVLQPFMHHTLVPKQGIYNYSFSLYPERFQPSGACNFARLKRAQVRVALDPCLVEYDAHDYEVRMYVVNYNFLRVVGGMASVAYA